MLPLRDPAHKRSCAAPRGGAGAAGGEQVRVETMILGQPLATGLSGFRVQGAHLEGHQQVRVDEVGMAGGVAKEHAGQAECLCTRRRVPAMRDGLGGLEDLPVRADLAVDEVDVRAAANGGMAALAEDVEGHVEARALDGEVVVIGHGQCRRGREAQTRPAARLRVVGRDLWWTSRRGAAWRGCGCG